MLAVYWSILNIILYSTDIKVKQVFYMDSSTMLNNVFKLQEWLKVWDQMNNNDIDITRGSA